MVQLVCRRSTGMRYAVPHRYTAVRADTEMYRASLTSMVLQNIGRKMTVGEFIENLADLNDGENYPKEVLKNLYHAIRTEPLDVEGYVLEWNGMEYNGI